MTMSTNCTTNLPCGTSSTGAKTLCGHCETDVCLTAMAPATGGSATAIGCPVIPH
jgi:hypothetical protein